MSIESKMQLEVWARLREQVIRVPGFYAEVNEGIGVSVDWQVSGRMWEEVNA